MISGNSEKYYSSDCTPLLTHIRVYSPFYSSTECPNLTFFSCHWIQPSDLLCDLQRSFAHLSDFPLHLLVFVSQRHFHCLSSAFWILLLASQIAWPYLSTSTPFLPNDCKTGGVISELKWNLGPSFYEATVLTSVYITGFKVFARNCTHMKSQWNLHMYCDYRKLHNISRHAVNCQTAFILGWSSTGWVSSFTFLHFLYF